MDATTTTTPLNKSSRMAMYNRARSAARNGKLDAARVNAAFALLQERGWLEHLHKYNATCNRCSCKDHVCRKRTCKHMIACMMIKRIDVETYNRVVTPASFTHNFYAAGYGRMSY